LSHFTDAVLATASVPRQTAHSTEQPARGGVPAAGPSFRLCNFCGNGCSTAEPGATSPANCSE
jgi:hypothetical protein